MTEWIEDICSEKPDELTKGSQISYIQRRNIHQVVTPATDDMPEYTQWVSESRIISIDEYNLLESIKEIKTDEAIDNYTLQLIEEGLL